MAKISVITVFLNPYYLQHSELLRCVGMVALSSSLTTLRRLFDLVYNYPGIPSTFHGFPGDWLYWSDTEMGIGPEYIDALYESPNVGPSTIEMSSYALLAYMKMERWRDARRIAQFLLGIRNGRGSFRSTQVR